MLQTFRGFLSFVVSVIAGILSPQTSTARNTSSEQIMEEKMVMDEIIQINLLEIQALILQLVLRPILKAYAIPKDLPRIT